jgi:hypothetical protein
MAVEEYVMCSSSKYFRKRNATDEENWMKSENNAYGNFALTVQRPFTRGETHTDCMTLGSPTEK